MATKLKNIELTSVDLVRAGANQKADICLYKSADPTESTEQPTAGEKNIIKRFIHWLKENPVESDSEPTDPVQKEFTSFDELAGNREINEKLWQYTDALNCSIRSIQDDKDLDKAQKGEMMRKSLQQFDDAMGKLIDALCGLPNYYAGTNAVGKADSSSVTDDDASPANHIDVIEEVASVRKK